MVPVSLLTRLDERMEDAGDERKGDRMAHPNVELLNKGVAPQPDGVETRSGAVGQPLDFQWSLIAN